MACSFFVCRDSDVLHVLNCRCGTVRRRPNRPIYIVIITVIIVIVTIIVIIVIIVIIIRIYVSSTSNIIIVVIITFSEPFRFSSACSEKKKELYV